jgi:ProP effector
MTRHPYMPSPGHSLPLQHRLARLCAIWPELWPEWQRRRFRPVKRGIAGDMRRWLRAHPEADLTGKDITLVLHYVTSRLSYLEQLTEGAVRVGTDGGPAETVSAADAAHSAKQMAEVKEKIARRKEATPAAVCGSPDGDA